MIKCICGSTKFTGSFEREEAYQRQAGVLNAEKMDYYTLYEKLTGTVPLEQRQFTIKCIRCNKELEDL